MFKIEKDVPIFDRRAAKSSPLNDTLREMQVGDSFVYPASAYPSNVYSAAKRLGLKVRISEESEGNYRVWRIQ